MGRTLASLALLGSLVGCAQARDAVDAAATELDAGHDASTGERDTGVDAPPTWPEGCDALGRRGNPCRDGECVGTVCLEEPLVSGEQITARNRFGMPQAEPVDPADPTRFAVVSAPSAAADVPVSFATGTLCAEACDVEATSDSCGTCAKCSQAIGADPLEIGVQPFLETAGLRVFGDRSGVCRAHCELERFSRGFNCRDGYTCDARTNVCLEACRTDAQCRARLVTTEDGTMATWIDPSSTSVCNTETGRCDWPERTPEPHVGDACARDEDCVADVGVCLPGGTCAEAQCNRADLAPDTTVEGVCDGGRGVCLGVGGNQGALCVQGCNDASDCSPGNDCAPLLDRTGAPVMIGTFSGYCLAAP